MVLRDGEREREREGERSQRRERGISLFLCLRSMEWLVIGSFTVAGTESMEFPASWSGTGRGSSVMNM